VSENYFDLTRLRCKLVSCSSHATSAQRLATLDCFHFRENFERTVCWGLGLTETIKNLDFSQSVAIYFDVAFTLCSP